MMQKGNGKKAKEVLCFNCGEADHFARDCGNPDRRLELGKGKSGKGDRRVSFADAGNGIASFLDQADAAPWNLVENKGYGKRGNKGANPPSTRGGKGEPHGGKGKGRARVTDQSHKRFWRCACGQIVPPAPNAPEMYADNCLKCRGHIMTTWSANTDWSGKAIEATGGIADRQEQARDSDAKQARAKAKRAKKKRNRKNVEEEVEHEEAEETEVQKLSRQIADPKTNNNERADLSKRLTVELDRIHNLATGLGDEDMDFDPETQIAKAERESNTQRIKDELPGLRAMHGQQLRRIQGQGRFD